MQAQTLTPEAQPCATVAGGKPRLDFYAGIHKALRLFLTRTLTRVGSTDPADAGELAAALQQVERLLAACALHLHDENQFIHPALERAQAGSAARIGAEHVHHEEAIADLRDLAALVAHSAAPARAAALDRLYQALALFVADNLQHMHVEQTAHNAVLWAAYSDEQLMAIEQQIVASIPPQAMAELLGWFMPALNAPERAGMLAGMRQDMPLQAFAGVLAIAEQTLAPADYRKLRCDLQ
jgi:hypothetical protein